MLYADAIRAVLRNATYAHDELIEIERNLLRMYFLETTAERGPPGRVDTLYGLGREGHRRLVVYKVAPAEQVIHLEPVESQGHADVAFELGTCGTARNVKPSARPAAIKPATGTRTRLESRPRGYIALQR